MTADDPGLKDLALRLLPRAIALRWIELLQPALSLRAARQDEPISVRLGGLPALPAGAAWPRWDDQGSLCFVASVDLNALPVGEVDLPLPAAGTLLFFYRDPRLDGYETVVESTVPGTQAGARVVYVPARTPTVETTPPSDVTVYPRVDLTCRSVLTGPDITNPLLQLAIKDLPAEDLVFVNDPPGSDDFRVELSGLVSVPGHQIAGFADPVQESVETAAAQAELGWVDWANPALAVEAARWRLLLQLDSDADAAMNWGDLGKLYWLMRLEDLIAQDFSAARFVWQTW